ncbi:MAG TPA: gamma-glutamyl-gamma-aminobutyrate hydrolase family protein [Longimicrobiales bacterium]|nr:gamma-glutamyl-gamma-aminobutyrate hydrolase family protein [Longimicrobiales bacterium]
MESRPTIGVTTQTLQVMDGIPEGLPKSWLMNHRYFTALTSVGAVPWMVPLLDDDVRTLRAIYDRLDGLFLPGGVDMDPASYGAERHGLCGTTDISRDAVELALTRWALRDGKPVLGVCRGMQVINVATGGTLVQDCTELVPGALKHDYFPNQGFARDHLAHDVAFLEGTRLRTIFGAPSARVNSMHHQGAERLGVGLVPAALAPDGLVEGLEGAGDAFLVGVQWHPEMLVESDAGTRRLFEAFIEAALAWRASAVVVGG